MGDFTFSGTFEWSSVAAEQSAWVGRDDDPRTAYDWSLCESPNAPWMTLPPLRLLAAATGLPVDEEVPDSTDPSDRDEDVDAAYSALMEEYDERDEGGSEVGGGPGDHREDDGIDDDEDEVGTLLDLLHVQDPRKDSS